MDSFPTRIAPESLDQDARFAHEVLEHYGFYQRSTIGQCFDLIAAGKPIVAEDGQTLIEAGHSCDDVVLVGTGAFSLPGKRAARSRCTTFGRAKAVPST